MSKVVGKDLEFWWDGIEYPAISENLSAVFDTLESTDSATPGDGKDHEVGRADRSFNVESNMYEPDGTEVVTGTLVAGTRYRVTGGTITETQGAFTLGMIFESDGTGTASATNKVKPLGSKITGKTIDLEISSADFPVTNVDFSLKYDELDGTDSATTGDAKETEVSRADRESKISAIMRDTAADLLTSNPVKVPCTLKLSPTTNVAGNIIPISKDIQDEVNGYAKVDYALKWVGKPVETNFGLAAGVPKAFKVILKRGTTNKEYTGTAVITEKTVTSAVSELAKITYTMKCNGAVTENVYS